MRYAMILMLIVLTGGIVRPAAAGSLEAAIEARIAALPMSPRASATLSQEAALADFYARRGFAPVWDRAERRERLRAALSELRSDGLHPDDYALPEPPAPGATPDAQAAQEVTTTRALLRALLHLRRGKVDPATLDAHWNFARPPPDVAGAMRAIEAALPQDAFAAMLEAQRPQHWMYERLRLALRRLEAIDAAGGWPQLADGRSLKPGDEDDAVASLRERLRITGEWVAPPPGQPDGDPDPRVYDAELEVAVRQFQAEQYLDVDGVVGRATRQALNVPVRDRMAQLRVNLERARWLLDRTEPRFVLVDIAGYRATYFRDGQAVWRGRVQIGRPYRRTPSFEARITYMTLNPTWTVPPTILRKDILPKLRKDPGYLDRNRIRVIDAQGRRLDPARVNLRAPGAYMLRQDAGEGNALGRVAIRFPNPYTVYMHDTPSQSLFEKPQRAFSSGCIRVEGAVELAHLLLDDEQQWSREALDAAIATGETRNVSLREPVPLLIAYWTVDVGADGKFAFRPDLCDRDPAVLQALDAPLQAAF